MLQGNEALSNGRKNAMIQQVRRASLSVHLNVAEGCSRKSVAERRRFYEVAGSSLVEIDAALDVAEGLGYISKEALNELGDLLVRSFRLISKMIG